MSALARFVVQHAFLTALRASTPTVWVTPAIIALNVLVFAAECMTLREDPWRLAADAFRTGSVEAMKEAAEKQAAAQRAADALLKRPSSVR